MIPEGKENIKYRIRRKPPEQRRELGRFSEDGNAKKISTGNRQITTDIKFKIRKECFTVLSLHLMVQTTGKPETVL